METQIKLTILIKCKQLYNNNPDVSSQRVILEAQCT